MISIILPNLNTPLKFLSPRIGTILDQTFDDWECIVIDGYSDNGSWEYILEQTANDQRFIYHQKPAKGIYDAWNEGIKQAKGEYIYIATSDDLCDNTFLQTMSAALNANPDCSLAHCCLNIIDEEGDSTPYQWHDWEKVKFYGDYIQKPHKRIAPYDAIVHFGWSTVYSSVVQLLIKRSLFNEVGYFSTAYGSIADFEWGLRASLYANVIHVPLYLANWRKHAEQATNDTYFNTPQFYADLIKMAGDAFDRFESKKGISIPQKNELFFSYLFQQFNLTGKKEKLNFLAAGFIKMPRLITKLIFYWLFKIRFDTALFLKQQLAKRNMSALLHD